MLETSARLLRLLSLLQTPREWTGAELAERLAVRGRTVRADVERLRNLGYPVLATRGSAGGYRLGAGAALPPLLLDDEEAVAVTVGLRTATGGAIAGIEEASLRAPAKLEQVLPSRLRRRVNTLQAYTVPVPRGDAGPGVDPAVLTTLSALCRDRERLRFDYHDHAGAATVRTVEPYRLVIWGRRWYLLAWDVARDDWRTFRVDRIRPRPRFTSRDLPDDDIAAYVAGRVSAAAWRYRAKVTVHAPAEVIADRIGPAASTVERLDDRTCVLHTGADTIETLAVHLGLLGADFDVSGPPELLTHLHRLARRCLRTITSSAPG
ncbi:helix-turn-helix transcriptional regulator [Streptosporangium roseum]|uniref:helix-turn-helix transcriptional regulator n=1 Tax=Streptosporangium roseum TaxID=2001 RepID=UPI00331AB70B